MRELCADLWQLHGDARCITTNGTVLPSQRGVMGKGIARQATRRYPGIELLLGTYLRKHGNHTGVLIDGDAEVPTPLVILPVKQHWYDPHASLLIIRRSLEELVVLADAKNWHAVILPRPGCGAGKLPWEIVERVCQKKLDDRFVVVEQPAREV